MTVPTHKAVAGLMHGAGVVSDTTARIWQVGYVTVSKADGIAQPA